MPKPIFYLPGLNGLRAIAAISVVISHTIHALGDFNLNPYILGINNDGGSQGLLLAGFGVSIFFALSGFLITYLLLLEKEQEEISIRKFYMRRILRIWPLYYLYLMVAVITILSLHLFFSGSSLLLYLFYAANIPYIIGVPLPFLSHYWSLGVEEQFYLFWPWWVKYFEKKLFFSMGFLAFFLVGTKLIIHFCFAGSLAESLVSVSRFQCMLIGAIGAILYYKRSDFFLRIIDQKKTQLLCWLVIALVAVNQFHVASVIDNELVSLVTVFLIVGQINIKNRLINLETKLLDFLGKISFGIYVTHPLVIFFLSRLLVHLEMNTALKYVLVFCSTLSGTLLVSYLSFELFEKYFLKRKLKFSTIKSSGSRYIQN